MSNSEMSAGTNAEQSTKADVSSVSQTIAKPHVVGSAITPKEKALRICQAMGKTTLFAEDCNNGYTLPLRVAKLLAHIAVDELIEETKRQAADYKDDFRLLYWMAVKTEIDNL